MKNVGNTTSGSYSLTDPVPTELGSVKVASVAPASAACTTSGNTVNCAGQAGLAPNATRVYTITGVVGSTVAGSPVNTASASMANEANTSNNAGSATITIVPPTPANLTISQSASPSAVAPGDTLTITVTVTNSGDSPSGAYTMTDVVPSTFTNVKTTTAGCTVSGNTVTCTDEAGLSGGASKTFTITAVAGNVPGVSANSVTVTWNGGQNSTDGDVTVGSVDMTIAKGASGSSVILGDRVIYTIIIGASGTGTGNSYSWTDAVPSPYFTDVQFVGATPAGCSINATTNTVSCTNQPGMAAGTTKTYQISAKSQQVSPGTVNTASVTMPGETETGNNSDSATVLIHAPGTVQNTASSDGGAFSLTKEAISSDPAFTADNYLETGGGRVTYRYTVKNTSTRPIYFQSAVDDRSNDRNLWTSSAG